MFVTYVSACVSEPVGLYDVFYGHYYGWRVSEHVGLYDAFSGHYYNWRLCLSMGGCTTCFWALLGLAVVSEHGWLYDVFPDTATCSRTVRFRKEQQKVFPRHEATTLTA